MPYVVDQEKLNAKNAVIMSLSQEVVQLEYQANMLEQSLVGLVVSYFDNGVSVTGDHAILELRQARNSLLQIASDMEVAVNFAEKLDVMTWVEDDADG
ncbi:TPA: hypothetical protein TXN53_000909 [Streptococcus suis]|uniref:hypothetical protein n=1 Tax=Streptococcus suis TaxID=1307 RepID=UPI002A7C2759|nr:hypothetical protein [Streptococcus suis]HEM2740869.1 hypothetical protein [Streptococcus suis]HEP1798578.1 hypothetical protein [Streptococcus suis]